VRFSSAGPAALKLGKSAADLKNELAGRRGGVDRLLIEVQIDAALQRLAVAVAVIETLSGRLFRTTIEILSLRRGSRIRALRTVEAHGERHGSSGVGLPNRGRRKAGGDLFEECDAPYWKSTVTHRLKCSGFGR
jgi:hypothetical protein